MWWLAEGEARVPDSLQWLSPREQARLAGYRFTKRRVEFLTRRWTAKHAVAGALQRQPAWPALAGIEILNHPGGAPYIDVDGRRQALEISLSDRAGWAVCVVGAPGSGAIGIDLELVEPRSDAFVGDFFTHHEAALVRGLAVGDARDEAANLIWSAKEAALKVLKVGLRADTRSVEVQLLPGRRDDGWAPLAVRGPRDTEFPGWWRRDGEFLLTLASLEATTPPARMAGGGDLARAQPLHSWLARPLA